MKRKTDGSSGRDLGMIRRKLCGVSLGEWLMQKTGWVPISTQLVFRLQCRFSGVLLYIMRKVLVRRLPFLGQLVDAFALHDRR